MNRLDGKVAIVTGAGGEHGFGRAMARRFAAEGADLILADIAPTGTRVVAAKPAAGWGGLDTVAAEGKGLGRRVLTTLVDVRMPDQIEAAVDRSLLVLDTNLKGAYLSSKAVVATMLERKIRGRVINISSNCGKLGYARMAAYCASKFGLIGFTQALAMELAPFGITVNAICLGAADTDRLDFLGRRPDGTYDPQLREAEVRRRAAGIPLGRLAAPDDVAEVAVFLASDAAAYITGQAINVAGGAIMH